MNKLDSMKPGSSKRLTYLSLIVVAVFLGWLYYAVGVNHMPVKNTAWALVPSLVAISLALISKEVYSSLFLGMVTGALLNVTRHQRCGVYDGFAVVIGVNVVCICLIVTYKGTNNISLLQLFEHFSYIELTLNNA